jgi:hypothetical protein
MLRDIEIFLIHVSENEEDGGNAHINREIEMRDLVEACNKLKNDLVLIIYQMKY